MRQPIQLTSKISVLDRFNVGLYIYISISLAIYYMIKERDAVFTPYRCIFTYFSKRKCLLFLSHKNAKPTNTKTIFKEIVLLYFILSI